MRQENRGLCGDTGGCGGKETTGMHQGAEAGALRTVRGAPADRRGGQWDRERSPAPRGGSPVAQLWDSLPTGTQRPNRVHLALPNDRPPVL